ncbi:MAG: RNA-binding protein [bacterium]|jgi:RNA recognition motif-containing protein
MNIYVGNLNYRVDESALESVFAEFGAVSSVKIITDKFNGRSKGFGFVTMDNDDEAKEAIEKLNGTMLENREMIVNEARPKKEDFRKY